MYYAEIPKGQSSFYFEANINPESKMAYICLPCIHQFLNLGANEKRSVEMSKIRFPTGLTNIDIKIADIQLSYDINTANEQERNIFLSQN